ncbi:MAG: hypothetical protein M3R00_09410, partial [Pseudomonadota bacterium]|nr:hypothetical protein [Pseudomonadota bacterium]
MQRIILIIGILLLTSHASANKTAKMNYVKHVGNYIEYTERNQSAVWPGFHPAATPSIILFQGGSDFLNDAYALNLLPGQLLWQALDATPYPIYYLADSSVLGLSWESNDGFFPIDNQISFIDVESTEGILESDDSLNNFMIDRARLYLQFDAEIDKNQFKKLNMNYDSFNDLTQLKLLYLEDMALTVSQNDSQLSEEALSDAVAIHQYRQNRLSLPARDYENAAEVILGTSTYIGWSSQHLNDKDFARMSQRSGCGPLVSLMDPSSIIDCSIYMLPAYQGAAYGRAMDKKLDDSSWKEYAITQFQSMSQLAVNHYLFTNDEAKTMTDQAMKKPVYNYDRTSRVIDFLMTTYLKKMKVAKAKYAKLPGIEFRVPLDWGAFLYFFSGDIGAENYKVSNNRILLENLHGNIDNFDTFFTFRHYPFASIEFAMSTFTIDLALSWT